MADVNPLLVEVITVTRLASKATISVRLSELRRERDFREKRGAGYGISVSDQWLERDIAILQEALDGAPPVSQASDCCEGTGTCTRSCVWGRGFAAGSSGNAGVTAHDGEPKPGETPMTKETQ